MIKYWNLKLFFILISLIAKISSSDFHVVNFTCTFNVEKSNLYLDHTQNTCKIQHDVNINDDDFKIQSVQSKLRKSEILEFNVEGKIFEYFPMNFDVEFPNLIAIMVKNSGLKAITKETFKNIPKLKWLSFHMNKLRKLEEGIFENNKELERITLGTNQIQYIHPDTFDHLKNLKFLGLKGNTCVNNYFDLEQKKNTTEQLKPFLEDIKKKCSSIVQAGLADVAELREKIERLKREITQNDKRNDKIIEKLNDLKTSIEKFTNIEEKITNTMNETKNSILENFIDVSNKLTRNFSQISLEMTNEFQNMNQSTVKLENNIMPITEELKNLQEAVNNLNENVNKITKKKNNRISNDSFMKGIKRAEAMEKIFIFVNLSQFAVIILITFLSICLFCKSNKEIKKTPKIDTEQIYQPSNISIYDPNYSTFENAGRIGTNTDYDEIQMRDLNLYDDLQNIRDEKENHYQDYEELSNFQSSKNAVKGDCQEIKMINIEESQYGEIWLGNNEDDCDPIYSEVKKPSKKS
ncbi:hypothetical protein PVAND_016889 [Polypedilum vanderplanki]|uniref:Uncharacterized protein n=1 Tax=Polypedilum vanderplanki TaxID=319348 RepID=A0A9J6BH03_POLVA|nr:hypothetical protein PVAND_016889 [Polypedilum vanderplanki]